MTHHGRALRAEGHTRTSLVSLAGDLAELDLDERTWVMLEYARKLTLEPAEMSPQDVLDLKQVGFDDRSCLEICLVTAYFNFVNRIALGLGVELENAGRSFPEAE